MLYIRAYIMNLLRNLFSPEPLDFESKEEEMTHINEYIADLVDEIAQLIIEQEEKSKLIATMSKYLGQAMITALLNEDALDLKNNSTSRIHETFAIGNSMVLLTRYPDGTMPIAMVEPNTTIHWNTK